MAVLRTTFVPNLTTICDEVLDEITADGHTFASTAWYRFLDSLPLQEIVGGDVELSYAVVWAGETPVCVTPVLRARGQGVYFVYSLRRYYFEHWIEEAIRMQPDKSQFYARLLSGVSCYRKVMEWTGSSLDDCLIVTGPLSYRGEIPVAPSSPVPRHQVYASLVKELQKSARRRRIPLWFLALQGNTRLTKVLETAECESSFLFYDNRIDLEDYESFDDYLFSFRRTTRRAFQRDMRRTEEAGVEFQFLPSFHEHKETLADLYSKTYAKYGNSFYRHPSYFWNALQTHLGDRAEAIVAKKDGAMLGFSILLHNERRGEMYTYRIGRQADDSCDGIPYYFGLSFYGPIQRAIERNYRRIWLGPASYEAKNVRGADQVPLFNYFWFPRRWDRWFLQPYLTLFGQVSKEEIDRTLLRTQKVPNVKTVGDPRRKRST